MSSSPQPRTCSQYTIGLITALAIEFAAVKAMLDENHGPPLDFIAKDDNNYQFGRIASHNVVIASLPAMIHGKVSAATTATQMARSFPDLRFGLLIGIGGGVPNMDLDLDIRLGDVVVGVPGGRVGGVVQYDLGKATEQGFKRTGTLEKPPKGLLVGLNALKAKHEWEDTKIPVLIEEASRKHSKTKRSSLEYSFQGVENDTLFHAKYEHVGGSKCTNCDMNQSIDREERAAPEYPRIHYGLIASGDSVIKSATVRDRIASVLRGETDSDCLCFEMEAAGLLDFPCLVVRGISDYADSHKNDRWQRYAAIAAAAFGKELLQVLVARDVEAIDSVRKIVKGMDQFVRETGEQLLDNGMIEKIKKWLEAPNASINYNRALSLRHPGTGNWLLRGHSLRTFKTANEPGLIWLHGGSGCGKTLLAASVIEHLGSSKPKDSVSSHSGGECAVLYFFFDFQDTSKQTFDGLLRSLVQQLSFEPNVHEAREAVSDLFDSCKSGTIQPSTGQLQETFICMISAFSQVQIVLDALDECPQGSLSRKPILEWIFGLFGPRRSQTTLLKVFMTSRSGQSDIESGFRLLQADKHRLSVNSRDDVHKFVHDRLEQEEFRWLRESQETRNKTMSTIMENSGNMFRLAELYMRELERCGSPFAVEEALKIMPNDLNKLYERSLQQVPPYHQKGVLQLLKLILYSEVEVVLETALHFMAIDSDTEHPENSFQDRKILKDYKPVFSVLSSLITITEKHGVLKLAHSSVKEFLVSPPRKNKLNADFSQIPAKSDVLKLLLSYIVSTAPRLAKDSNYTHDYVGKLADKYRPAHDICDFLRYLVDKDVEQANQDTLTQFFQNHRVAPIVLISTLSGNTWSKMYKPGENFNTFRQEILGQMRTGFLHAVCALICADLGWGETLKNLWGDLDINACHTRTMYPPLNLVCFSCWLSVDKVGPLLEAGASPNLPGPDGCGSALLALIVGQRKQYGPTEMVVRQLELMLTQGVDINISNGEETALQELVREPGDWKDLEVIELLLQNGANPNAHEVGESPLSLACLKSAPRVVRRLLECGADVDSAYNSETPLSQASNRESSEGRKITKLLLDYGADVGFALSLLPKTDPRYKSLAVIAADVALKKDDEKAVLRILSDIGQEDAVSSARVWQRFNLVEALIGYRGHKVPSTADITPAPWLNLSGIPRTREDTMESLKVVEISNQKASEEMAIASTSWVDSVETDLLHGRENRARISLSYMDPKKAFLLALSERLPCLTRFFLREAADHAWLDSAESRLFVLETALEQDETKIFGIPLTAKRKREIFRLVSEAGVDWTRVSVLANENVRAMLGELIPDSTRQVEFSGPKESSVQPVSSFRPGSRLDPHPRQSPNESDEMFRLNGFLFAESLTQTFGKMPIPKYLPPSSHGAVKDTGGFIEPEAPPMDTSDEDETKVSDMRGLFKSCSVGEIEWLPKRVEDGRKPFAAFDTLRKLASKHGNRLAEMDDDEEMETLGKGGSRFTKGLEERKRPREERDEEDRTEVEKKRKSSKEEQRKGKIHGKKVKRVGSGKHSKREKLPRAAKEKRKFPVGTE